MKKGVFITFEGIDASGKSSQIKLLKESLEKRGLTVNLWREPGASSIGEKIRQILLDPANQMMDIKTELLLFEAARAQIVKELIKPALSRGEWVICDRFYDSSLAYQGYGRGLDLEMIKELNRFAVGKCVPDLTFLLHFSLAEMKERLKLRVEKNDRLDQEQEDFYQRVIAGYLDLAAEDQKRFLILDASLALDELAQLIWAELQKNSFI